MKSKDEATEPQLRFSGFNGNWCQNRLGELSTFRRGSFPQPYGLPQWYDEINGTPFVQVYDVGSNFRLKDSTKQKISELAKSKSVFVKKGTIVLTIQGSIGRIAITQYDSYVDRTLLIFKSFKVDMDVRFFVNVVYLLFDVEKRKAPGGTIKTITKDKLKDFIVAYPSLPEQQKIAAFLSAVDQKIQQLTRKKELLETYKKGLMQQLFSGDLRFTDEEGKAYPDWEEKRLGEVATFLKGKGISKKETNPYGEIECIRYGELYTIYNETIDQISSRTSLPLSQLVLSEESDVIIPASGESQLDIATASCVTRSGIALGGDLNIIRSDINGVFLALYLNGPLKLSVARLAQGASVLHLYSSQLKTLKIRIPCFKEQEKISSSISIIDAKTESISTQITKTQTFKKGLLQQMFV